MAGILFPVSGGGGGGGGGGGEGGIWIAGPLGLALNPGTYAAPMTLGAAVAAAGLFGSPARVIVLPGTYALPENCVVPLAAFVEVVGPAELGLANFTQKVTFTVGVGGRINVQGLIFSDKIDVSVAAGATAQFTGCGLSDPAVFGAGGASFRRCKIVGLNLGVPALILANPVTRLEDVGIETTGAVPGIELDMSAGLGVALVAHSVCATLGGGATELVNVTAVGAPGANVADVELVDTIITGGDIGCVLIRAAGVVGEDDHVLRCLGSCQTVTGNGGVIAAAAELTRGVNTIQGVAPGPPTITVASDIQLAPAT